MKTSTSLKSVLFLAAIILPAMTQAVVLPETELPSVSSIIAEATSPEAAIPPAAITNQKRLRVPAWVVFTKNDKKLLSELLKTAVTAEISGTVSGDKVLNFFRQEGNSLAIEISLIPGYFAQYDPDSKTIIFNESTLQRWMRTNNVTLADLQTKPDAVNQIAALFSASFVHEATHQEQLAWAQSNQLYYPYTQESELEASAVEVLYIIEKTRKDPYFAAMVSSQRFAGLSQSALLAAKFQKTPDEFDVIIRNNYKDRPSFEAAAAEYLAPMEIMTAELKRREKLSKDEQEKLENEGWDNNDNGMPLEKAITSIKTSTINNWVEFYGYWHSEHTKRLEEVETWINEAAERIIAE